ncbi:MAG: VWA domain-containing protein [Armatimonadetes bacterium]|nr:VWA domain-containing protein [Armatimonadota bacterium]
MLFALAFCIALFPGRIGGQLNASDVAPGQLTIIDREGKPAGLCPLKETRANIEVAGFGARVTVVQEFTNPTQTPIEAIYTFPLPHDAAVDRMRIKVGGRTIVGEIKRREEAYAIYAQARREGRVAALLDQERPNIFTQSVANIMPGATVEVEISYVHLLKYEDGWFELVFPMVVGPRFIGASVRDPDRVVPPITPKGTRTGTNVRVDVYLDAGAEIQEINSVLHEIKTSPLYVVNGRRNYGSQVHIELKQKNEIPNRDFILRYRLAEDSVTTALLTHADPKKGGYFTLVLMPPKSPTARDVSPKELIFVIDRSGSQRGFPIEKSKELAKRLIGTLAPNDTFNVISFSNEVTTLWPAPEPNTPQARAEALRYIEPMKGNGGTLLLNAVLAALRSAPDPDRLRIVLFQTDGYVGNDFEILEAIQRHRQGARMFTFGIGNSVNRFLIDSMSVEGRGDAEYVTLEGDADAAAERFERRIRSPILTDISVQFDGVAVADVLPAAIPDVFSEKPVIVRGRYERPGQGRLTITGRTVKGPWTKTIILDFPAEDRTGSAIASLWARAKVDDLMRRDWIGQHEQNPKDSLREKIIALALEHNIMSQYTSFVAVEQRVVNVGGKLRTVRVPVEMPEGVSYAGIFGDRGRAILLKSGGRSAGFGYGAAGAAGKGGGGLAGAGRTAPPTLGAKFKVTAGHSTDEFFGLDYKSAKKREEELLAQMKPEERRKYLYETRVAEKLREVKSGEVEVQVWLKEWKDEDIAKLKKLGLKVDDKDESLKILFGTCDAKVLIELAQIESVRRIAPLEP